MKLKKILNSILLCKIIMINSMIKKIIYILLGFSFIFFTIYYRMFVIRLPKNLFLFDPFNYKLFLILLIGIITSIIILYKSIVILYNKYNVKPSFLYKLSLKFNEIIDNAFFETYNFCQNYIEDSYEKFSDLATNFYSLWGNKHEGWLIFISIFIRFIIVSTFLIDVFVFFKLKYFYIMLYLLIIPLCINVFIFILKDFAKNIEEIKSYLTFTTKINEQENTYSIVIEPSPGHDDLDLIYNINQYKICKKVSGYLEAYDFYQKYYNIRSNIIIYSLYLFGWLYILVTNILLLM